MIVACGVFQPVTVYNSVYGVSCGIDVLCVLHSDLCGERMFMPSGMCVIMCVCLWLFLSRVYAGLP